MEYNETANKAARAVVDGKHTPGITFEEADPPIGGLRTWPQIRHNPPNKPENIRKLTNLKAGIKRQLKHTNKTANTKGVFGRLLQAARGTGIDFRVSKHTPNPHTDPDETHMQWPGDYTSTNAKRNTTHRDQCYAPNVTNNSQTHNSLEVVSTTLNYARPDIIARSNYYMKN